MTRNTRTNSNPTATARAHSNIAVAKYWGKRDGALNLPATGSISLTLADLYTDTTVTFRDDLAEDVIRINATGTAATDERTSAFLDLIRDRAAITTRAEVNSRNNFPTSAGLASSASGFAALALAASHAAGLELSCRQLSILARQGSGSAARSIFGGIAEMHRGEAADGHDAYAECLTQDWPLAVVIAITDTARKSIGSTAGMTASADTSPYYSGWVDSAEDTLAATRRAIAQRDFTTFGELTEHSCLKMHGLMLSTRPGLLYWNAATVAAMHAVRTLRDRGTPVYFTIDAGPQVKAICQPRDTERVAAALRAVAGVVETRTSALGPGAQLAAAPQSA